MARQKLSEFRTKDLLYRHLGQSYHGVEVTPNTPLESDSLPPGITAWVAKVDQGVKKRGKLSLMKANLQAADIEAYLSRWRQQGYQYFIVEPMIEHGDSDERYLSLERTDQGVKLLHSQSGGMEIESQHDTISTHYLSGAHRSDVAEKTGIPSETLIELLHFFNRYHFSFLEINPYLLLNRAFVALDAASFVDDAAQLLVRGAWTEADYRRHASRRAITPQEKRILQLAESSQASFRYELINPDGAIFVLLSGGGASVVLADEINNRGAGALLANYGEYSGNPNEEETYVYTQQILESLLQSSAKKKVLIIAGGVANFTDIRATFLGIRKALSEKAEALREAGVKVHIRRGGPYEIQALQLMEQFLVSQDLFGSIGGSKMVITDVIEHALKEIA